MLDISAYKKILREVDEYIIYIKERKRIISDAVSALSILWLGELLSKNSGELKLSADAVEIIEFRHRFSHAKPEGLGDLQEYFEVILKLMDEVSNATDLINGVLQEDKKKVKSKHIKAFTNEDLLYLFKDTELNRIIDYASRIINAPKGNLFNLERNYIIFPEFVTRVIDEPKIRSIIFDVLGNHAVLRLVKNIKEDEELNETCAALAQTRDGKTRVVYMIDAYSKKQVDFKDLKSLKRI